MWNKAATISITVVFANLFFALWQRSDSPGDCIPFLSSLNSGRIDGYDFFLLSAILLLRPLALHFGISLPLLRSALASMINYQSPSHVAAMVISGLIAHVWVWPILLQIFADPIDVLQDSPGALRRTALMTIPVFWAIVLGIINKGRGSYKPPTQHMPPQSWQQP